MFSIEINRVLTELDYNKGILLYEQLGKDEFLKKYFSSGHSEYKEKRLWDELEKLKEEHIANPVILEEKGEMPTDVRKVLAMAKEAFKAMKLKRQELFVDDRETRRKAALQILELSKLNKECWNTYDYWKKHGSTPDKTKQANLGDLSILELTTQLNLDKNYIWKFTKKIQLVTGEKKRQLELEIERRKNRVLSIQEKLLKY